MARGNRWEMTYDPVWDGPTETASLEGLDGSSGLVKKIVRASDGKAVSVRWRTSGPVRLFQQCDISEHVTDSLVSNCTFSDCRFKGSRWVNVKFSRCKFIRCDFTGMTISRCHFISDCEFESNSSSGELFRIEETAISATAFLNGLTTNLKHYGSDAGYQLHRFVGTREKLAKAIFVATRNEAEVDYYFQGFEQLVRCTFEQQVEQHRFEDQKVHPRWRFWLFSFPARLERRIVLTSAWLTEWGRSLLKAFVFFAAMVTSFAAVYTAIGSDPYDWRTPISAAAFVEALNVSLVAGYTAHFRVDAPGSLQAAWVSNLILGIYWYSLVVPVLSRRFLR